MPIGDFNVITSLNEKSRGSTSSHKLHATICGLPESRTLSNLNASRVPFTWTNSHKDNTVIFEKLDRVMANS